MDSFMWLLLVSGACLCACRSFKLGEIRIDQTDTILAPKCPYSCKHGGQTFCGHIPCPLPLCDVPLVLTPGDCCKHCPLDRRHNNEVPKHGNDVTPPDVGTKNVTTHFCPYPCKIGNETLCYPPPCQLPPCVDARKQHPGDCCEFCPNGPDCAKDGEIILWHHWKIVSGRNCTCVQPLTPPVCS